MKTRQLFTAGTLAAAALVLVCSAPQVRAQNMAVYSNALVNSWQNYSYSATLNFSDTSPVYTGCQDSVSVTITSGWGAFAVYHTPMSDASYASISFWLNGGTSGGQNLQMYGALGTSDTAQGARYYLSTPAANTWQQYTVPLSALGVSNQTTFSGFAIQDSAGTAEPTFYLDSVQLNGSGPLAASAGSPQTICAGSSAAIGGSPTASGGIAPYTYSWSPATGLSSATVANPTASPANSTTYTVTVTDSSQTTAQSSVTVTFSPNPAPTASAGGNQAITAGTNTAGLGGVVGGGATGGIWTTSGSGTFVPNATTLNATYDPSTGDITTGTVTLTLTTTGQLSPCGPATAQVVVTIHSTTSGGNPTTYIGIDAGTNRKAISPLIYGVAFGSTSQLEQMGSTANRSGGNEETTYNWATNVHGKGADWYFECMADNSSTPGQSADEVVSESQAAGAQPLITIPMIGWTPKVGSGRSTIWSYSIAKYGPQTGHDTYETDAGNGISTTNNTAITWNNPNDSYVPCDTNFQKTYVQHLISTWGVSTNGGVGYYCMDNEHSIWYQTHQDIHPVGPTMQEILGKIEAYSSMVKSLDPNALVLGPEEWGWIGYLSSGYDMQHGGNADSVSNGGMQYSPWLLNQLHQYQTTNGQRLLDYFTLHCYPQEGNVGSSDTDTATELLRNQTTRQFWDTNYVDPSWINSIIMLIPRMSNWVATYYPGTKIGVTEYNWGGETSMNGATAQADLLGIFGRQGLDLATRWTVPASPTLLAMQIYRNYDGNKSTFGDTSVLATVPNPDNVSAFAAERSKDGALTIMVVNKYLSSNTPVVINLTNYTGSGSAQVWQLNSNAISQLANLPYSGGVLQATVPNQSVTLFVIPPSSNLSLLAGAPRTDGYFAFSVNGEIGGTFVLQSSPDLINWTPVSTNTFGSAQVQFLLPVAGTQLFYRVVSTQL